MSTTIKGYKFDFTTNTLTLNYKFNKAANVYGSQEYRLLQEFIADFPNIKIIVEAGRKRSTNKNTRMKYENIEKHISAYKNKDELLAMYRKVLSLSKSAKSPYKYVTDWFKAQFPDYDKLPNFINGELYVKPLGAPDIERYKPTEEKQSEKLLAAG